MFRDETEPFRFIYVTGGCGAALGHHCWHQPPRVEGARESEILDATVRLLVDVGYDKLTLDAVAAEARASKATLYRRWKGKADLVVDAVHRAKACGGPLDVDTGSSAGT